MLKVNLVSDLHLELQEQVMPGGDILLIAGDLAEARSIITQAHQTKPVDREHGFYSMSDFLDFELPKYNHVLYVLGNHEHYHGRINDTKERLQSYMPANTRILEDEYVEIDGVVFVGATLWTDLNNEDPLTEMSMKQGMNDYHQITARVNDKYYRKLHPRDTLHIHKRSKKFIETVARENPNKPIVVVTHHAPTAKSIDPRYADDRLLNGAYFSNLENLILDNPNIKFWCHGHVHTRHDYQVGNCFVITNPRGYVGFERTGFDPNFSFEVQN